MKKVLYLLLPLLLLCGCSSDEPAPAPDRNSRSKEDLRKIELYKEYGYFFIDVIDGNPYDAGPLGERGAHFYREVKAEGETVRLDFDVPATVYNVGVCRLRTELPETLRHPPVSPPTDFICDLGWRKCLDDHLQETIFNKDLLLMSWPKATYNSGSVKGVWVFIPFTETRENLEVKCQEPFASELVFSENTSQYDRLFFITVGWHLEYNWRSYPNDNERHFSNFLLIRQPGTGTAPEEWVEPIEDAVSTLWGKFYVGHLGRW